jgi:hypothetical protein
MYKYEMSLYSADASGRRLTINDDGDICWLPAYKGLAHYWDVRSHQIMQMPFYAFDMPDCSYDGRYRWIPPAPGSVRRAGYGGVSQK